MKWQKEKPEPTPEEIEKFIANPGWTCRWSSYHYNWMYDIGKVMYKENEIIRLLAKLLREKNEVLQNQNN
jgi:hypothetical protein